ncbi:MAG: hypothetical protein QOC59_406, partial [Microbacteriaceae bacterium]|nr:hypothetical protein [Microbacteriaceae bacterium]
RGGRVTTDGGLAARPDCAPRPPSAQAGSGQGHVGRTGLSVRVRPRRDRRPPRRFTTTGSIKPPPNVSRTAACEGRISIQVKAGRNTISNRGARVTPRCRFRSTVRFGATRRFGRHRRLRFTVRFQGNAALARRTARPIWVRVR